MNINWKLRLQNKTTLITLVTVIVAAVYNVFAAFGATPSVSQDMVTDLLFAAINVLAALGIVVDPTTSGVSDSTAALEYKEPRKS